MSGPKGRPLAAPPLRLAYVSPLPPTRSGIADYSRALLPHLAQHADLTLFTAEPNRVASDIQAQWPVEPLNTFPSRRFHFDLPLYQMGNNRHHIPAYEMLGRFPGITVLHDYALHLFHVDRSAQMTSAYTRELGYARGGAGVELAWQVRLGERPSPIHELPLSDRLLDLSLGVLIHSRFVQQQILAARPHLPTAVIPHLMTQPTATSRRAELGWPGEVTVFASVGQVTAAKRLDQALSAFSHLHRVMPQSRYLIVGDVLPEVDLESIVSALGLGEAVHMVGHAATLADFHNWIATADLIVHLREPTIGETSGPALRALSLARPLIVYDHGWYAELPDTAVVKVPPGDEAALLAAMMELATAVDQRRQMGQAGQQYVAHHCRPEAAAAAYMAFIQDVLERIARRYD